MNFGGKSMLQRSGIAPAILLAGLLGACQAPAAKPPEKAPAPATAAAPAPAAAPAISSQVVDMSGKCETEAARTNALQVDDPESNFERCPGAGGIPAWKMQQDLHYITYGFGREPNTSGPTNFSDSDGPPASVNAEWRGVTRDGRFVPFAVIMRLPDPEKEDRPQAARDNPLYVFRLTEDGKSCVVDKIAPGPDQQAAALRSADRMAGPGAAPACPPEPEGD